MRILMALVIFTAIGPGGLKFTGKTSDVTATESDGVISVTVELTKLDTGISLRDQHMRDKYLEVGKYPTAVLKVDRSALKLPKSGDVSSTADGTLTIKDKTKPTKFDYVAKQDGDAIAVEAKLQIDLRDYGIEVPNYLGVTVKPQINLTVTLRLQAQS